MKRVFAGLFLAVSFAVAAETSALHNGAQSTPAGTAQGVGAAVANGQNQVNKTNDTCAKERLEVIKAATQK